MQNYCEDFPPLRQNVTREVSTARSDESSSSLLTSIARSAKDSRLKVKRASQKVVATSGTSKQVSSQAAKENPIPQVFVSASILSSSTGSSPRKGFGYSVNEDTYYDDITETEDNHYIEFEVYQRPEAPISKMAAEYNMYCSDSDGESDGEEETPLQITYKPVPYGCIINSNVYLSTHQWHTLVAIDDKTMLCAVCDLYTDYDTYEKHLERSAHECNLKKCPPLHKFDMSITRKIRSIYHCGVCNEFFGPSEREIHFNNKMHEGNLLFAINKATDILYYDNANNCDNKENAQAQGFNTKKMSARNEDKDCYYFNANNINNQRDNKDNYKDNYEEDDNLKFINYQNNFDYADEFEYEEPEVPIAGISYAKMAKTPKVEVQKFIEVDLGDKKVKVRFDSYHMIIISKKMKNEFWCMVCKLYDHLKNKFIHCHNPQHINKLVTFRVVDQYEDYFIRQVDTKLYHCGHCNNLQMVHDMEDHIQTVHPRETKHGAKPSPVEFDDKSRKNMAKNAKELFKNNTKTSEHVKNNTNNIKTGENNGREFPVKNLVNAGTKPGHNIKMPADANVKNATNLKAVIPNPNVKNLTGPNVFKVTHTPPNANVQAVKNASQTNTNTSQNNNRNDFIAPVKIISQTNNVTSQNDFMTGRGVTKKQAAPLKIHSETNNNLTSQNSVMTNRNVTNVDTTKELMKKENIAKNNQIIRNMESFEVTDENIVIYPFGCKMVVPILSYNVVCMRPNDFYCGLCDILFAFNIIKQHICDIKHIELLQRTPFVQPFKYHLIRAIRDAFHCTICNCPITADKIWHHPNEAIHTAMLIKCLKHKPQEVTCELGFTGARETQGAKPIGYAMTNDTDNMTSNQPNIATTMALQENANRLAQQENVNKITQFVTQNKPMLPQNDNWQYTSKNNLEQASVKVTQNIKPNVTQNVKPNVTQANNVAQNNHMAQDIPFYVSKNTDFAPNARETALAPNSYRETSNNVSAFNFGAPTSKQAADFYNMPPNFNSIPQNINPMFNFSSNNSNNNMTSEPKPSTWSYKVDSDLEPEKLTHPVNTNTTFTQQNVQANTEHPVNATFTQNVQTNTENVQVNTEKTSPVKQKLTHEMAKIARYELQNAKLAKNAGEKIFDFNAKLTTNSVQANATSFNNPNIKNDQENSSNKQSIAEFIAKNTPQTNIMAREEKFNNIAPKPNNNIQEAKNTFETKIFNNPNMAAKDPAPVVAAKPPAPIMAPKPPAPIMSPKPPAPIMAPKPPAPIMSPKPPAPIMVPKPPAPIMAPKPPAPIMAPKPPAPIMAPKPPAPIMAPKPPAPIMAPKPPAPIMAAKPPAPLMATKVLSPNMIKEMPFVIPDLSKPPPNIISFDIKNGNAAPVLPYTKPDENYQPEMEKVAQNDGKVAQFEETVAQNEDNTTDTSDIEENLDEEEECSSENDEFLDESMDKTFESQGSDDVRFDNEEYVYLNLKNTYIKISNTAYNTLVHLGDGSRYCFVCSEQVDYFDLQKHVDSRSHIEKMDGYRFLDKYEHHLLRQNFLNYHCAICNVIVTRKDLKSHIEWNLHIAQNENTFKNIKTLKEIKGGVKHVAVSTTKEIIYLNEHEPLIKIFLNVNVKNKKKTDSDYYEAGSGNVTKVERLNKSDVVKSMPNKEPKVAKPKRLNKLIFIGGSVLKVSWENWHGVSLIKTGYKCNLCQRDLHEAELDEHCASDWHSYSLKKEIEKAWLPALIRKINESALNCIVCNTELPNKSHLVKEHVNGKKHVKNYDMLKCESEKDNTYDDCDEDVFNVD